MVARRKCHTEDPQMLGVTVKNLGHAVVQLVEALCCKPESCGVDSWRCHWSFSLTWSSRSHYGLGVGSASNRNVYKEYFLEGQGGWCLGLMTLLPSYADCLENLGHWNPPDLSRPVQGLLEPKFGWAVPLNPGTNWVLICKELWKQLLFYNMSPCMYTIFLSCKQLEAETKKFFMNNL
jgi:hypothetical protein